MNNIIGSIINGRRVRGLTLLCNGFPGVFATGSNQMIWADRGKPEHAGGLVAILEHNAENRIMIPHDAIVADRDYAPELADLDPCLRSIDVFPSSKNPEVTCVAIELGGDSSAIEFIFELQHIWDDEGSHDCDLYIGNGDWASPHVMLEYMPTAIKVFEHFGFHKKFKVVGYE
jgi:hypothetical protein